MAGEAASQPAATDAMVLDRLSLGGPVRITEHDPAAMAGGSPVGEQTVTVTFDALTVEPLSLVMPVAVLRQLVAASAPFLVPPPGACAPASPRRAGRGRRRAGGDGDG